MWRRLWALCLSMPDGKTLVRRLHKVSRRRGYGSGPGFSSSLVSSPEGRTLCSPSEWPSSRSFEKPRMRQDG